MLDLYTIWIAVVIKALFIGPFLQNIVILFDNKKNVYPLARVFSPSVSVFKILILCYRSVIHFLLL